VRRHPSSVPCGSLPAFRMSGVTAWLGIPPQMQAQAAELHLIACILVCPLACTLLWGWSHRWHLAARPACAALVSSTRPPTPEPSARVLPPLQKSAVNWCADSALRGCHRATCGTARPATARASSAWMARSRATWCWRRAPRPTRWTALARPTPRTTATATRLVRACAARRPDVSADRARGQPLPWAAGSRDGACRLAWPQGAKADAPAMCLLT